MKTRTLVQLARAGTNTGDIRAVQTNTGPSGTYIPQEREARVMMKFKERRKERRVVFEQPFDVRAMTIDGTWSGEGVLIEMTDGGARLGMTGHATELIEFFLILNSFGPPVFRLCKRVWVEGKQMGVSFNKTNIGIKSLEEVRRGAEEVRRGAEWV